MKSKAAGLKLPLADTALLSCIRGSFLLTTPWQLKIYSDCPKTGSKILESLCQQLGDHLICNT